MRDYGPLIGLLVGVAALGHLGIGAARVLFMAGSFAVAALAYRGGGLSRHAEVAVTLFVFGPFLRRVIDVHVGFDPGGTILVGPLLALMAAFPELRGLLSNRLRNAGMFLPFLLITACMTYGWTVSAFQNSLAQATIGVAKYMVPMVYSVCLVLRPDQSDAVLRAVARTFLVVCPLMGLYGIAQYFAPQPWDTYWMVSSKMLAVGLPEPRQVRVFSTMNSPTSFAFYATCGLLLFSFMRSSVPAPLMAAMLLPLSVALLLSGVRSAWISAAMSLLFCLLFTPTRGRAGFLMACLAFGMAFTLLYSSFGASVASRLSSLGGSVSQDGSGSERLHDYIYVFTEGRRYLFGGGLSAESDPNLAAFDGQLLVSVVQMGLVIGSLHVLMILWAGGQALLSLRHNNDVLRLAAGAVIFGQMAVFLLLAFSLGEIGFLFWMLVGLLTPRLEPARRGGAMAAFRRFPGPAARPQAARP